MVQGKRKSNEVSQMVWGAFSGTQKSLVVLTGDSQSKRGGVSCRQYFALLQQELPHLMLDNIYVIM